MIEPLSTGKAVVATGAAASATLTAAANGGLGGLPEILTSGGVTAVGLGVGWILIKRSDSREADITKRAQEQLREEQEAHSKTQKQLMDLLEHRIRTDRERDKDNE